MRPQITGSGFGWIEVASVRYDHDVVIEPDGAVRKRRKKLSKAVYGTSHRISLQEAQDVYGEGMTLLLVAGGTLGRVALSDEARAFFDERGIRVIIKRTPQAIKAWHALAADVMAVGLFHTTC